MVTSNSILKRFKGKRCRWGQITGKAGENWQHQHMHNTSEAQGLQLAQLSSLTKPLC